jgi:site-specific DNA-methyltransferase (adenine-specific)/site-specific DNA-methyltransferase (cytosine-N4-specific)
MTPPWANDIFSDDCGRGLQFLAARKINLFMTSPPYADQRKKDYGGIHPDKYVEWFLPKSAEMFRTLADDGSLVINIKEKVVKGERHTYVLDLILALKKQGWLWTEEYIWHKKNCNPGYWPNRFRDAWERCLHFTKDKKFFMDQEAVMVPMGDWRHSRLKKVDGSIAVDVGDSDLVRSKTATGSNFGRRIANWVGRDKALPSNVLHLATECGNKKHSAAFPKALPEFFIKLLSRVGDVVCDPFAGSGTTLAVAKELGRNFLGFDTDLDYVQLAKRRVGVLEAA